MGYFEKALVAAVLIGTLSGLVGSLVVLRRRTFFAQALTHATFPGAVGAAILGYLLKNDVEAEHEGSELSELNR